ACRDNGCNPFFELTPFVAGHISATATWAAAGGAAVTRGQLTVEAGNVAARDLTRTRQPYRLLASADRHPGLMAAGRLPHRADAPRAPRAPGPHAGGPPPPPPRRHVTAAGPTPHHLRPRGRRRASTARGSAALVALALALGGCTGGSPARTAASTPSTSRR